jgi:hypothetical protein
MKQQGEHKKDGNETETKKETARILTLVGYQLNGWFRLMWGRVK